MADRIKAYSKGWNGMKTSTTLLPRVIVSEDISYNNMTEEKVKDLYFNELVLQSHEGYERDHVLGWKYRVNRYGYRSPDFHKNTGLLSIGCSMTNGDGIIEDSNVWGHILANKLGISFANLGQAGDSVHSQIKKSFAYFKQFGNPEYLVASFPDFFRFPFPSNMERLVVHKKSDKNDLEQSYIRTSHFIPDYEATPAISKMPHRAHDVITEELRHYYAIQSIWMLEQYCQAAGIKFAWTTWVPEYLDLIDYLKGIDNSYFKSFVDIKQRNWKYNEKTNEDEYYDPERIMCHQDYSELPDFHLGMDRNNPNGSQAHHGVHRHMHWAEEFFNKLKES